MKERALIIVLAGIGLCLSAGALTGSGDSASGALETVRPTLDAISVPTEASIEATFSEAMLEPGASTAGNYAVSGLGAGTLGEHPDSVSGSGPYTLTWTTGEMQDGATVTLRATGVQDAVGNPIDTSANSASATGVGVAPVFSGLAVDPAQASVSETVTITFSSSEDLDGEPIVTVNGNPATVVSGTKATNFTCEYVVLGSDPLGAATIAISGFDGAGNLGTFESTAALEIVEETPELPIRWWPAVVVLLLAGVTLLAFRRRKSAALLLILAILVAPAALAQGPSVSNVAFTQQDNGAGGTEVVITYDLVAPNGPCDIAVSLSKDGGVDGFIYAVTSVTGDLSGVTTGAGHTITWDIAADYPDEDIPNAQIRVTADDGAGEVWYVDKDNDSGTEDGTSWATAFDTIQEGIDAAYGAGGGEVWVAEGVYDEPRVSLIHDPPVDTGSLSMREEVNVYGGFAGDESLREDRDWTAHVTTVEGSTSRGGQPAYHVVVAAENTVLDGFTVTGGDANGAASATRRGGGLYAADCAFSVANCMFHDNAASQYGAGLWCEQSVLTIADSSFSQNVSSDDGGGMYLFDSSGSVTGCAFSENDAADNGGGIQNYGSSPVITNCSFTSNTAHDGTGLHNTVESEAVIASCTFSLNEASFSGGGMRNWESDVIVVSCVLANNTAASQGGFGGMGGGIANDGSSATITNCLIYGNSGEEGGGVGTWNTSAPASPKIVNCTLVGNVAFGTGGVFSGGGGIYTRAASGCSCTVTDCIVWENSPDQVRGNTTITYSDVEGGAVGEGNIDQNPVFMNEGASEFHLQSSSPCVDTGRDTSGSEYGSVTEDLDGNARGYDGDGQGAGGTGDGSDYDMGAYEFVHSIPEMISVAAGTFTMGRRDDGDDGTYGEPDELPRHDVTLSAYEIGKYEVTNQQVCDVYNWADDQGYFTTVNGSTAQAFGQELLDLDTSYCHIQYAGGVFSPETRTGLPGTTTYSMADHPVQEISWYGAVAYCNWLSEILGLTPVYNTGTWAANFANNGYHLPTEAQWERAAAWDGSKHWIYSFLSDALTGKDRCNYHDGNPLYVNPLGLTSSPYTSPFGWFDGLNVSPNGSIATQDSPSPLGCYDMSGNVWEACHDWYDANYYTTGGPPWVDPAGPASGLHCVARGGCYGITRDYCRTAIREHDVRASTYNYVGFRLARTLMVVPSVQSFAINGGDTSTPDPNVSLDSTCTGVPWEYMASEQPEFTGATWEPYDTAPTFTLSPGAGTKTVYLKVRNAKGQSAPVTDTIELTELTERTILLPGDVPLELVWILSGSFQMGRYPGEADSYAYEDPQHPVTLAYGFWMGKYEVTQEQWLAVRGSWPGTAPSSTYGLGDTYPAYYVSWNDAQDFVTSLNAHIVSSGQGPLMVRLPSEAEWEYACRAGTATRFYFGDSLGCSVDCSDCAAGVLPGNRTDYMWYCGNNSPYGSKPVGGKTANAFGLHDMSGNVSEWCEDDWHGGYVGAPADGTAWIDSPRASSRMIRGGYWSGLAGPCRSASRDGCTLVNQYHFLGFRLAAVE